jgi:hypothetical protein
MGTDNWIVNNRAGEEWGLIKRLILDSATRQINFADVVVIHTGQLARIPWDSFEIRQEGITLGMCETQAAAHAMRSPDVPGAGNVSLNVGP